MSVVEKLFDPEVRAKVTWPYVRTMAANEFRDALRKSKRFPMEEFTDLIPEPGSREEWTLRCEVAALIDRLPPKERAVIYLRDIVGHTWEEIAEGFRHKSTKQVRLFRKRAIERVRAMTRSRQ